MLTKTDTTRAQRKERKALAKLAIESRKKTLGFATEWDRCGGAAIALLTDRLQEARQRLRQSIECEDAEMRRFYIQSYFRWKEMAWGMQPTLDIFRGRSLPLR